MNNQPGWASMDRFRVQSHVLDPARQEGVWPSAAAGLLCSRRDLQAMPSD